MSASAQKARKSLSSERNLPLPAFLITYAVDIRTSRRHDEQPWENRTMPRTTIRCDAKGVPFKDQKIKLKQGDVSINVDVTHDSKVGIKGYEDCICATAMGSKKLHESTKVKGIGTLTPKGYIHAYSGNVCFLVTRLDTSKHTIQIDKQGKVNSGMHEF